MQVFKALMGIGVNLERNAIAHLVILFLIVCDESRFINLSYVEFRQLPIGESLLLVKLPHALIFLLQ